MLIHCPLLIQKLPTTNVGKHRRLPPPYPHPTPPHPTPPRPLRQNTRVKASRGAQHAVAVALKATADKAAAEKAAAEAKAQRSAARASPHGGAAPPPTKPLPPPPPPPAMPPPSPDPLKQGDRSANGSSSYSVGETILLTWHDPPLTAKVVGFAPAAGPGQVDIWHVVHDGALGWAGLVGAGL